MKTKTTWPKGRWQVTTGGHGSIERTLTRAKAWADRRFAICKKTRGGHVHKYAIICKLGEARIYVGTSDHNRGYRWEALEMPKRDTLKAAKLKKLEAAGWQVGSPAEFLGLSTTVAALLDVRIALRRALKTYSRTKLEANDPAVTLDQLVHSLFVAGVSRQALAKIIAGR